MKFVGIYSITVGVLMFAQWLFFIVTGQVPELQTEPIRIMFHLFAEALTACALITSGIGLLKKYKWGRAVSFFAMGMLVYTGIVSPGYFAQRGVWPIVGMFVGLLILSIICIRLLFLKKND